MNRRIVYQGSIPQDLDILLTNKNVMTSIAFLTAAVLGNGTVFDGLACAPTGPASLQVLVAPGSVYAVDNMDATAYGSVAVDTTHQIVKQGISLDTLTLSCPAPGTVGQSRNYLIQGAYQNADTGSAVLPYYNASNPAVAFNGPANSGTSQNQSRDGQCTVNVKAGVAATTGTQTTPAADAGFFPLWVVTVANGQTTITSGNIVKASAAPFINYKLPQLSPSSIPLITNTTYNVSRASGNDSTGDGSVGAPWATLQKAVNWIYANIYSAGFQVKIKAADDGGTPYSAGAIVPAPLPGGGTLVFEGNLATPANCRISTTSADCIRGINGAFYKVGGFKCLTTTSGFGVAAIDGAQAEINGLMDFGACANSHIYSHGTSNVRVTSNYNITGGAERHILNDEVSHVEMGGLTVTLTGTPAFGIAFAESDDEASLQATAMTYSGSATGVRYIADGGTINTNGGGSTYFPGSVGGSAPNGGEYK